jgi:hypothetical protein
MVVPLGGLRSAGVARYGGRATVGRPPGGAPHPGSGRADGDAEVLRDAREAGRVALADGAELPLRTVAVELAEDHRRLGRGVLREVVARELGLAGLVHDADERVADLAEALAAVVAVVDRDGEDDLVDLGRDGRELDLELLVVAVALTGEVVAQVLDGAVRALEVVEEHEVAVGDDLAVRVDHDRRGVEVEVGARRRADVPPEPDDHGGEAGCCLGEADVPALAEADSHGSSRGF